MLSFQTHMAEFSLMQSQVVKSSMRAAGASSVGSLKQAIAWLEVQCTLKMSHKSICIECSAVIWTLKALQNN